jgi:hypothetical protein
MKHFMIVMVTDKKRLEILINKGFDKTAERLQV